MLVLSRKPGEQVRIGMDITFTVLESKSNRVRIGITAPDWVPILRGELCSVASGNSIDADHANQEGHDAAGVARSALQDQPRVAEFHSA